MKRVYTCFCTDVIHEGHRNIIREAGKYGELTIGVLSDAAMIRFNRFPTISFEERMQLVKDIPEVSNVVVQDDVMYDKVIEELHPDYVIHGDNWQEGALKAIRDNVEGLLKKLELPYRILRLCGGDMSFTSAICYDFEVYSEAQQRWLEVSSVSNFDTYQANRLKCRYRTAEKKTELCHTLNGSALALPRIVAALLENNQTPEGIRIPKALVPYCGFDRID